MKNFILFSIVCMLALVVGLSSACKKKPDVAALNAKLFETIDKSDADGIKKALDEGAEVNAKNQRGESALIAACNTINIDIIKLLLEKGADINAKDPNGVTALGLIVMGGGADLAIVKLLIEKKADMNAKTADGRSILKLANGNNGIDPKIIEALKAAGAKE